MLWSCVILDLAAEGTHRGSTAPWNDENRKVFSRLKIGRTGNGAYKVYTREKRLQKQSAAVVFHQIFCVAVGQPKREVSAVRVYVSRHQIKDRNLIFYTEQRLINSNIVDDGDRNFRLYRVCSVLP